MRCVAKIIVLLLIFRVAPAQNTAAIRGRVVNGQDMTPLRLANVFLANTTRGAITDSSGHFELTGLQAGGYRLVVSFVGYKTVTIDVQTAYDKNYAVILQPEATILQELVVTDKRSRADRSADHMKAFRDYFIGLSEHADQCTIVNDDALSFTEKGGILTARADSILVIVNAALGYRIKFLLEQFSLNMALSKVKYRGQMVYESLDAQDPQEQRRFAENRLKAYYGSELHFMRSLYNRRLLEEGFFINMAFERGDFELGNDKNYRDTILRVQSPLFEKKLRISTLADPEAILDSVRSSAKRPVLSFIGVMEVTFIHEAESPDYLRQRDRPHMGFTLPQRSGMRLHRPGVAIEPNGMVLQEEDLSSQGYWSWELMAESLPVDYYPAEDLKLLNSVEISIPR